MGVIMHTFLKNGYEQLRDFWLLPLSLILICVFALINLPIVFCYIPIAIILLRFILKPMNTVYALVGTSGSGIEFIIHLLLFFVVFSWIYYCVLFQNAGVCYNNGETFVEYEMFSDYKHQRIGGSNHIDSIQVVPHIATVCKEHTLDGRRFYDTIRQTTFDTLHFKPVKVWVIMENTILTSLQQCPTEFFYCNSVFAKNLAEDLTDKNRVVLFSTILIIQVLFSWLFLGVFISLLYNKFRYEA